MLKLNYSHQTSPTSRTRGSGSNHLIKVSTKGSDKTFESLIKGDSSLKSFMKKVL